MKITDFVRILYDHNLKKDMTRELCHKTLNRLNDMLDGELFDLIRKKRSKKVYTVNNSNPLLPEADASPAKSRSLYVDADGRICSYYGEIEGFTGSPNEYL